MEPRSLYQLFRQVVTDTPDRVAYRRKQDGGWVDVSWAEQGRTATDIARALIALGVDKGDRVCILGETRLEWVQADLGIISAGGVTVGIYHSNLPPACGYIVDHCEAEVLFAENLQQLEKIQSVRSDLPGLRRIVLFEGSGDESAGVLSWREFLKLGEQVPESDVEERGESLGPEDMASFVYTSGTTGVPKGAMLSHRNLVFVTGSAGQRLAIREGNATLLFLPLAHVFARLIYYCCMRVGATIAFAEDIQKVPANLKEIRPEFLVSVPRIYEKVHQKIIVGVEEAGGLKRKLFEWAMGVGRRVSRLRLEGRPVPPLLKVRHALADRLVFSKIRAALGGRIEWAVSGAAPLNSSIGEFFHACGVLILEGLGMTENSSFSNVNLVDHNKFGTVGPVGPGIEMRIANDGEVLFRGDNVMTGYYKNDEATAEAIDSEGWLHTGDIGEVDTDGFLKITDRKKDLIVTSGGKNVAPQRIERIMRTSPYISEVVAYGDRRKYITALITLDAKRIVEWARKMGLHGDSSEELAELPQVRELIEGEIAARNGELASFESIKKFSILPRDFSIESGELTPTLKVKRRVVFDNYRDVVDRMYED